MIPREGRGCCPDGDEQCLTRSTFGRSQGTAAGDPDSCGRLRVCPEHKGMMYNPQAREGFRGTLSAAAAAAAQKHCLWCS